MIAVQLEIRGSGPIDKEIQDLANDLRLAADSPSSGGRGRAVFLVGAGCSVSAGIPAAPGVARHCARKLAASYSNGAFAGDDAEAALQWLTDNKRAHLTPEQQPSSDGGHWAKLYQYFFEVHYKAPNQQREIINEIISQAGDRINWAHACLGELVRLRYTHTVLTTNFDQLVLQGIVRAGIWPVTADGLESVNRITGSPKRPQVVHLHGSMHTYNLRNSTASLAETEQDTGAVTMIHTLLQQSDVLVVVGYGGGEEGIMHLLRDAARTMPQLVIYWVTYEAGRDRLSVNAQELLRGENKFIVWGGSADKFFGDLMAELGIGQPQWVRDPISALQEQSSQLITPLDEDLHAIGILVRAYKERVEHAAKAKHRWPETNEAKVRAAEMGARGDFPAAHAELEKIDLAKDTEAKRLHALNSHSLFETTGDRRMLDLAIREFKELTAVTDGNERFANVVSMMDAQFDLSDLEHSETPAILSEIISETDIWQKTYTRSTDGAAWAQLKLRAARASQALAETRDDDPALLKESQRDYEAAIEELLKTGEHELELLDAKAGLAAVLQVLGEKDSNEATLRKSVELFREVLEQSRRNTGLREDAGPLANLSGALLALSKVVGGEEAALLLRQARSSLEAAAAIYEHQGDRDQAGEANKRLEEVASRIAAM